MELSVFIVYRSLGAVHNCVIGGASAHHCALLDGCLHKLFFLLESFEFFAVKVDLFTALHQFGLQLVSLFSNEIVLHHELVRGLVSACLLSKTDEILCAEQSLSLVL